MNSFRLKPSFVALSLTLVTSACAASLLPGATHAQTVIYSYNINVNGDIPTGTPYSDGSWMKVTIDDLLGASKGKGVKVVVDPHGLNANEFISAIGFNLSKSFLPQTVSPSSCTATLTEACPVEIDINNNKIDIHGDGNGGKYDLGTNFMTANLGRLYGGMTSTFEIALDGLSFASFFPYEPTKPSPYSSVAKVQGIGENANLSGVIGAGPPIDPPANEAPAPLPLLGAAAAFQASRRLRRRLKPTAAAAPRSA